MNKSMQQLAAAAMIAASALAFTATPAYAQNEGQVLVDKADTDAVEFPARSGNEVASAEHRQARGVLIVPEIVKAGFIIGGSGGRGPAGRKGGWQVGRARVLYARDRERGLPGRRGRRRKTSRWS
jgi:lipid-binding SYLF domain-containing protein